MGIIRARCGWWRRACCSAPDLSRLFTIQLDGYALRFYPTNVSANLWINPDSRFHDLSLFKDYCRPGDTVVDVGANIGEVSIVFSQRVGAAGQVFAFEPQPRVFQYLLGNLALNRCSNVTARNVALGSAPGAARMSDDKQDDMNRITQVRRDRSDVFDARRRVAVASRSRY